MWQNKPLVLMASAMQLWFLSSQIATTAAPAVPKTRKKSRFHHNMDKTILFWSRNKFREC
jgi:hypothetical protein